MAADFKSLGKLDQGALAAGGVAIILSFISKYVVESYDGPGPSTIGSSLGGFNAWTSYAKLGMLLLVASTAIVGVKAFAKDSLPAGVPWNLVAAGTAALGTVLLILRALFPAGSDLPGLDVGPGWSGYLLWIAGIALTVFTILSFTESGEKIPELSRKKNPPDA
ncbi:hypothetical protein [Aeromicrobium sp.]|uniref:hypothetical protein n=1 Tax=Aeromicrobium sp. TaxID=1871063 RepID=UPI00199FD855|nr:hypothetical protein [Aeromicrobium sp.]MBC7630597.1 hypothetical protein [Aeromicrobium sp.]